MSATDGYVLGTTKVVDHGSESLRWDLVILGDGYRASEINQYHADVQAFVTAFRATPPFTDLFCGVNVHRIDVVSTDSGADEPAECGGPGSTPRTFLDATFCSQWNGSGLERLLTIDSTRAVAVATAQVPMFNQVLVIVNSSKYGGSGGQVATCSTHASSSSIAIHEIGHSAFGLADEYGGNGAGTQPGEPPKPNVTRDANRATNKWRDLVGPSTPMPSACDPACTSSTCVTPATPPAAGAVGAYEGAWYSDCNLYRPTQSCYMRDYSPFCPVCSRVIRQTLVAFLPAESINPVTPSVAFTNVPAGVGGVGVTTHRAIVFEVVSCRRLTFTIISGPTGGFGTPGGVSVQVSSDPILPVAHARLWLSYTSTSVGSSASGSVTVRCTETEQTWVINIVANTVARKRPAIALVLDRSGSMNDDAGDATTKVQKLREAASVFLSLLLPRHGIGVVRFNNAAQRIMEVLDGGGAAALTHIMGTEIDPSGGTSIGDGVVKGRQMLDAAQASASTPYDVQALVVLTDGQWNVPPSLTAVGGSINARTYAVGLGLPSNISVPALTTLCQGHNGFLLITGYLAGDQSMRLSKYFLQILASVTNAQIAADPRGVLDLESEHRIPFWVTEADYGMDLIVLSPSPQVIDFQLETPDGQRIDPASGPSGTNSEFTLTRYGSFYRCALPVIPSNPHGSHGGLWQAVLRIGRPKDDTLFATHVRPPEVEGEGFAAGRRLVPYEFVAHVYSSVELEVTGTQSGYDVGATLHLVATLLEYDVAVGNRAALWAQIERPDGAVESVALRADQSGQFSASYELKGAGVYAVRVRATGETSLGYRFERERSLTATAVPAGDIWHPDGPRPNGVCELLECLDASGSLDGLREKGHAAGIDLDALTKCLGESCRTSDER